TTGQDVLTVKSMPYEGVIGDMLHGIAFSPDGTRLAISGQSGMLVLDSATGETLLELKSIDQEPYNAIAYSPDGQLIAIDGGLIDAMTGQSLLALPEIRSRTAFSPDGKQLVSSSLNGTLTLWDASTGRLQRDFKGHSSSVGDVAFSPVGTHLASASLD